MSMMDWFQDPPQTPNPCINWHSIFSPHTSTDSTSANAKDQLVSWDPLEGTGNNPVKCPACGSECCAGAGILRDLVGTVAVRLARSLNLCPSTSRPRASGHLLKESSHLCQPWRHSVIQPSVPITSLAWRCQNSYLWMITCLCILQRTSPVML